MRKQLDNWGLTIVATFVFIIGVIGNIVIEPSVNNILGLLTGTILLFFINIFYVKYAKRYFSKDYHKNGNTN